MKEEPKQELPNFGTKEFNNVASVYFGGKTQKQPKQTVEEYEQQGMEKYSYELKQETLEEAFKKTYLGERVSFNSDIGKSFELGAKWQQEQDKNKYSEEEVRQMLWDLGDVLFNNNQNGIKEGEPKKYIEEIIEQFKKK